VAAYYLEVEIHADVVVVVTGSIRPVSFQLQRCKKIIIIKVTNLMKDVILNFQVASSSQLVLFQQQR
jgi:hypothetical protein